MSNGQGNGVLVVLCTCPDEDTASGLARGLVEAGLAACVNILPEIRSLFRWQGKVQSEPETLMIIKTSVARYSELETWLARNHPYDVPEVLALPVGGGLGTYLGWVVEETG